MEALALGIVCLAVCSLTIVYYVFQDKPGVKEIVEAVEVIVETARGFAYVLFAIAVALGGWQILDYKGWIPHRQVTAVWSPVEEPWAVGEYLDCTANPMPPLIYPGSKSRGIDFLGCARNWEWERGEGNLSKKEVQVRYWGRISIPYPESLELHKKIMTMPKSAHYCDWPFRWRCRRDESSLTCWAVN